MDSLPNNENYVIITLKLFQPLMCFFLRLNTKQAILMNVRTLTRQLTAPTDFHSIFFLHTMGAVPSTVVRLRVIKRCQNVILVELTLTRSVC